MEARTKGVHAWNSCAGLPAQEATEPEHWKKGMGGCLGSHDTAAPPIVGRRCYAACRWEDGTKVQTLSLSQNGWDVDSFQPLIYDSSPTSCSEDPSAGQYPQMASRTQLTPFSHIIPGEITSGSLHMGTETGEGSLFNNDYRLKSESIMIDPTTTDPCGSPSLLRSTRRSSRAICKVASAKPNKVTRRVPWYISPHSLTCHLNVSPAAQRLIRASTKAKLDERREVEDGHRGGGGAGC